MSRICDNKFDLFSGHRRLCGRGQKFVIFYWTITKNMSHNYGRRGTRWGEGVRCDQSIISLHTDMLFHSRHARILLVILRVRDDAREK